MKTEEGEEEEEGEGGLRGEKEETEERLSGRWLEGKGNLTISI